MPEPWLPQLDMMRVVCKDDTCDPLNIPVHFDTTKWTEVLFSVIRWPVRPNESAREIGTDNEFECVALRSVRFRMAAYAERGKTLASC